MTIVNVHMKDEEKRKLLSFTNSHEIKSISEFVRDLIGEKLKIEQITNQTEDPNTLEIPDYIPRDKYVAFVNGVVVAVGDSPSAVSLAAVQKFPNLPFTIIFNGDIEENKIQYCYMSLTDLSCWNYSKTRYNSYPILPIGFQSEAGDLTLNASIDTAATLCVLKEGIFPPEKLSMVREESIYTAAGIIQCPIYPGTITILDAPFQVEFIFAPINDALPFQFFIGRNLLDELDAYFFGKKQIFCLKAAGT